MRYGIFHTSCIFKFEVFTSSSNNPLKALLKTSFLCHTGWFVLIKKNFLFVRLVGGRPLKRVSPAHIPLVSARSNTPFAYSMRGLTKVQCRRNNEGEVSVEEARPNQLVQEKMKIFKTFKLSDYFRSFLVYIIILIYDIFSLICILLNSIVYST